jgi:hypothetical protein
MKILVFAKPHAKRASIEKMENIIPGFDASFSVAVEPISRIPPARVAWDFIKSRGVARRQ